MYSKVMCPMLVLDFSQKDVELLKRNSSKKKQYIVNWLKC